MRELFAAWAPIRIDGGVLGVPGVPGGGEPLPHRAFDEAGAGTPRPRCRVPGVPTAAEAHGSGTPGTPGADGGVPTRGCSKPAGILADDTAGTPSTPGTPPVDLSHGSDTWSATEWSDFLDERIGFREFEGGHIAAIALQLAWDDALLAWHNLHGRPRIAGQCAGCEMPIDNIRSLTLPDGSRVHFDTFGCLDLFIRRWRREDQAALVAIGLTPPGTDLSP